MKAVIKQHRSHISIDDELTSKGRVWLQVENEGGGAATTVPLNRLRSLVDNFPQWVDERST